VGDIAFIGVSTDGATDADDSFAFVLLKDIEANTAITFTDRGWNDGTGFVEPLAIGDGEFTWISLSAHNAGHVVILNFANLSPGSAAFTVLGDQLFAIQGTISSPIFIAGMQLNNANGSDNTNWDGAATSNTTSALPDVLTTGDTAIRFPIEQDNWQFTCATGLCPLIGTADEIRAILHNPANWISDNNNVFPGTIDIGFGTPTIGPIDNIPPVINCPADIVFDSFDNQQCGGIVNWDTPIVTDNLPGVTVTSNFNSGDLFPFDTTEVNYTATDAAGNQASCSFMVTVNDKVAPTLTCINGLSIPLSATTGTYTISPLDFIASPITDACGELIYTISRATLDSNMDVRVPSLNINCDDEETILIRIWVEDVNGNSDYCETYVLVDKSLFMCPVDPEPCQVMITSQPDNAVIYEGDPLSYNVTATGTGTLSYQWQVNTGNGFEDLGVPSANSQLSFAFMEFGGDGNQYQVIVTSDNATPNDNTDDCFVISEIASLTVNPLTRITVLKDVFGTGSNPDLQFKFFYNTSIPNELGEFYLSESGVNSPNTEGGEFSFKGGFLFLVSEVDLPEGYSINDIQFISKNSTSNLVSKNTNEIQILIGQSDNVTITFVNQFLNQEPCEIFIQGQPRNAEICAGNPLSFNVGAISTGNLIYQWQVNSGTGFENLGLPSGNSQLNFAFMEIDDNGNQYKVVITSDNDTPNDIDDDCSETSETVTLQVNPKPVVYITGNNSYCYNGNGVQLDAGAGYTSYLWSPGGETTQIISALEGSYTVKVTNEYGCNAISDPFIVTNNQPLVCNILQDVLSTDHLSTDGVATVYTEGGTGQYTYLWDNGETTQTATTLTYGLHSVKVTDSNGCETSCQIDMAKQLYCWTNLVQNVSVLGGNDGVASVKGNGGYRPYSFKWDDGSTNEVNSELTPGTHYVVITDASGATSQCSVTIAEPTGGNCDTFMVNVQQDRLSTNHLTADGVATVHPKGGTAPYSYFWDNGETSQTASTLTYGIHTVIVSDYNECKVSIQIDIAKELYCWVNLYNNVSIHGENDGQALVRGNGGFRPYTFLWDDGSTEEVNSNLSAGTHYVTITDASGATSQCSIIISEPNQEVCDGIDNDGDGKIDEGFDQDGDGIADCFDICDKGDDHVDIDNDSIPDACDDNICVKSKTPWLECYQTAEWSEQTCSWEVIGEQPMEPVTECYETAIWNGQTCSWDIVDGQPEMPITECYQTAEWSEQTCSWEVIGEQPMEPVTECYETAIWNGQTCDWDITGEQPQEPETECNETAVWSEQICDWEIVENNNDCGSGTIDQCETAFARSADENVRTCFLDIPNISANRWGWTNMIPSVNGNYELDLYAAAGQCDITKGALVGNVNVVYVNGLVDVTVTVLSSYKMTETQLYVGNTLLPLRNNGSQTVAPGQYPYQDNINGDFNTYTFTNISVGDLDSFYIILHANVCPNNGSGLKTMSSPLELTAYPIPFKEELNLKLMSPGNINGKLYLYDGIGREIIDFGMHSFKKGKNEINLNLGELPIGIYFIHLKSDYGNKILKVLGK
tara:strand:- start:2529 stop:7148 length:4620 start_codon:yes stop_codon:yes gene_type:complete